MSLTQTPNLKILRLKVGLIPAKTIPSFQDSLRGSSVEIGAMQRRLAWPLRKDSTRKSQEYLNGGRASGDNREMRFDRFRGRHIIEGSQAAKMHVSIAPICCAPI